MIVNRLVTAVTLAAAFLAVAFGLRAAQNAGLIDAELAKRIIQAVIGLVLAAYANLMPKQIGAAKRSIEAQARAQTALRVGGWAFSLAGLAYAGLWAFAPLGFADMASMVVVGGAMLLTLGFAARCFAGSKATPAGG